MSGLWVRARAILVCVRLVIELLVAYARQVTRKGVASQVAPPSLCMQPEVCNPHTHGRSEQVVAGLESDQGIFCRRVEYLLF